MDKYFPYSRTISRDTFESLAKLLSRCKNNTLYRPLSRPGERYSRSELDDVTTLMLVDEFIECVGEADAERLMRSVASDIAASKISSLSPETVCPSAASRLSTLGNSQSLYDLDGIDYLCWTAMCEDAAINPDPESMVSLLRSARDRGACARIVPRSYTCFPERSITSAAARKCYIPESITESTEADVRSSEWDSRRETVIAEAFRSTMFGGPSVASIISSSVCCSQTQTRGTTKPKAAKKQRQTKKLSDVRLRRIAAGKISAPNPKETSIHESVEAAKSVLRGSTIGDTIPEEDEHVLAAAYTLAKNMAAKAAASTSRRGTVQGVLRGEDEFGDPALDVPIECLLAREDEGEHVQPPLERTTGPATLSEFATSMWGPDCMRCVWVDSMTTDAVIGDPYEDAYPCACTAELVADIVDGCRKCVVDGEMRGACEANRPRISSDSVPMRDLRRAVRSIVLDMAFGTLHVAIARRPGLVDLVKSNRLLMYTSIPEAIRSAIASASRPTKWMATVIKKERAREAALGIPFSRDPEEIRLMFSSAVEPVPETLPIDVRQGTIRLWCHMVQRAKDDVSYRTRERRTQEWFFAPVDFGSTIAELVRSVDRSGMFQRALELASAAAHAGNSDIGASVAIMSPPFAWPCDVCLGATLAADVLEVRQVSVGIPVCIGANVAVVLPKRGTSVEKKIRPGPTDALVFGSMAAVLGGSRRARSVVTGCAMIYPFAFVVLEAAGSVRTVESEADDARKLAETGGEIKGPAVDRANCWDVVVRAAAAFLSDACLGLWCASSVSVIAGTQPASAIPPFSEDMGAVNEDSVHPRRGWVTQMYPKNQRDALLACETAFRLLEIAAPEGSNDAQLARGFVCATRPMRSWTIEREDGRRGIVGEGSDLVRRTEYNLGLLKTAADDGRAAARGLLSTLALAAYDSDRICPRFPRCAMNEDSCGDGCEAFARAVDLERPVSYPDFDESLDGSNVPSLDLLASEFVRRESMDAVLSFMCRVERANRPDVSGSRDSVTVEVISECMTKREHGIAALPLAVRPCDGSLIRSDTHFPISDNPMTLARSRPIRCDACGAAHISKRMTSDVIYGKALLPKNSPMLAELVHRRRGSVMMQHAWPTRSGQGYPELAAKAIGSTDGEREQRKDDAITDPNDFEIMMRAEELAEGK